MPRLNCPGWLQFGSRQQNYFNEDQQYLSAAQQGNTYRPAEKSRGIMAVGVGKHVDLEAILEDYAWRHFTDVQSMRKTKLEEFRRLEREDVDFEVNMRRLRINHSDPDYTNLHSTTDAAKPYTLFKSVYSNNTDRPQEYSFKTERSTESVCMVCREQGYSLGQEAELSLKTPCEILEFKAGFKHEMNFNKINENSRVETLTWSVDSNVVVPPHYQTVASIVVEEMSYQGSYVIASRIAGPVTVIIRRRKDGQLVLPITANITEIFRELFEGGHVSKDVKSITTVDQACNCIKLVSKGTCSFQFAMKQKVDLQEKAMSSERETMMID